MHLADWFPRQHGSFGGFGSDRDSYFAVGSDDFRAYLWKIPDEHELLERRRVVEGWEWFGTPRPGEIGALPLSSNLAQRLMICQDTLSPT